MTYAAYLLTINIPPSLEEALVDCLLTLENAHSFTSLPISAHEHDAHGLSTAEQVLGRQKKLCFQLYVEKTRLAALLSHLKADFSGSGLEYWITPVTEHGKI
jgi:hypothetical protein